MKHRHIESHKGFTLLEFVIVIILMGILAKIAVPKINPQEMSIESEARRILGDIRYTQALSITRGQQYRFVKASSTTYQILNQAGTAMVMPLGGTTQTLIAGVTFTAFTNLPNNLIAFGIDGTPYVDISSTALASTAIITITSGSNTRNIDLSPQTGYGVLA